MSESMEREVYKAAVNGDVTLFSNPIRNDQLLKKTHQNNNILHIAVQHERVHFIKAALNNFPNNTCELLLCEQNRKGNTPLHIAAEVGDKAVVERLCEYYSNKDFGVEGERGLPWRIVNSEGNTPAQIALLYGNFTVVSYLVEMDVYIARIVNKSMETLLHIAIQSHVLGSADEDLWHIIDMLLKIDSSVACWSDVQGSTPLHIATSLKSPRCLQVIKAILGSCSEAAEVQHESSGQCVLHLLANHQIPSYEEGVALLNIPEVYALRNCKDHLGNTPLHVAAMNKDINMVRAILGASPKLNIRNKNNITAGSLVEQLRIAPLDQMRNTEILVNGRRTFTEGEWCHVIEANIPFLNETIESVGVHFLNSQALDGGNILHILMSREFNDGKINVFEEFIGQAITEFPLLITEKDGSCNTPVHILAGNANSVRLLNLCHQQFEMKRGQASDADPPWRLRNIKGDTPLHVAARARCDDVIEKLVEFDDQVVGLVNNRNETPLHLRCYSRNTRQSSEDDCGAVVRLLTKGNGNQAYMQDVDGLTPLHIACRNCYFDMISILLLYFPNCSKLTDLKERNLWHMFVSRPTYQTRTYMFYDFLLCKGIDFIRPRDLMTNKDIDGNTPLHMAIANQHFDFAEYYISHCKSNKHFSKKPLSVYLEAQNNNGTSCYDLIGSAEHLPRQFEKFLWSEDISLYGHRSMYGVPTTKIYDYANTIGVIAALLATITFTAAFTVPGGLDSSNGTPFLLKHVAFQVFLVSDVVALCLSVMVLFCLLWIMTTGHKRESLLLLDVSVLLLETSFYATLLTFMTGLYITVQPVVPSIAIFTCVICSFLILVMRKTLVMVTIAPICGFLIFWSKVLKEYVNRKITFVWFWMIDKVCD